MTRCHRCGFFSVLAMWPGQAWESSDSFCDRSAHILCTVGSDVNVAIMHALLPAKNRSMIICVCMDMQTYIYDTYLSLACCRPATRDAFFFWVELTTTKNSKPHTRAIAFLLQSYTQLAAGEQHTLTQLRLHFMCMGMRWCVCNGE